MLTSTIAAIATAPGPAGIAIVRISGPQAYQVAGRVFEPKNAARSLEKARGYTALFGYFVAEGRRKDEAVALCFRAPASYTGEDVVELSVHGGDVVARQLLSACYRAGAEPAGAGEFTKRAFLSGKISLTQAEAVMELIHANGEQAAAAAHAAMEGALYRKIHQVTEQLTALASHIAAYTDYPEEDVPELSQKALEDTLTGADKQLADLIDQYAAGSILRRGVTTAIVGSPNVGKSTLMNLLSGWEKAIVTPIAGTTRDVVEQDVQLAGATLLLADTAGIRQTDDPVEAEGVRRSLRRFEDANLVLAVFDSSRPLEEEDRQLAARCAEKLAIAILNKTDLPRAMDFTACAAAFRKVITISANDPNDLTVVDEAVREVLQSAKIDPDAAILANERQLTCARTAHAALTDALSAAGQGYGLDAVSVCVDDALDALYQLTGEKASDVVIDEVFSRFCVGK